ncbi:DUF1269 domain-containing protein [Fundidesulfovibrio soli]|uniref:DUF1269 domain-containing protein n=1 Tax=Fundidesulfovibrio soli TaxID=2922716 RepID=UPI001FAF48F0|nr:DUF1269 domain-containing protein [Fundidesulfovibrio soli]
MSEIVAVAYGEASKAADVRRQLLLMEKEYLSEVEDAVVVEKLPNGKIFLNHMTPLNMGESLGNTFLGNLLSLVIHGPEPYDAIEHLPGAVQGALRDAGVTDAYMKDLAEALRPGQSALFVMIRPGGSGKVIEKMGETGGKIVHLNLAHKDKSRLIVSA